jgi:UDP-N-acetylglucosamine acyltransferase
MMAQRMGARLEEAKLRLAESMAEVSRHRNRVQHVEVSDAARSAELRQLQEIWNLLYRSDRVLAEALLEARRQPLLPAAAELCAFLEASVGPGRRGPLPPPR